MKSEEWKSKNRQASVETCRFLAGAGGLYTSLRSVASLSCGQRPHFAKQKRQTCPARRFAAGGFSPPNHIRNRKVHRLRRWTFLFGRGRRIRTRDPRFWSGSKSLRSLDFTRFSARFRAFFSQDRVSQLCLKNCDTFLMLFSFSSFHIVRHSFFDARHGKALEGLLNRYFKA